MHTDHEVLEALRSRFDEDGLAAMLGRVLRVPEAWDAMRNPAFLDEVISVDPPAHLTASHLARLALGGELAGRIHTGLIDPHRRRAKQLWEEFLHPGSQKRDLFDVALLGLEFVARLKDGGETIDIALGSPHTWRSPLSVVWPALPDPEAFLAQIISAGELRLAIHIALTNFPVEKAASYLTRNANGSTVPMLLEISRSEEPGLVRSLDDPRIAKASHAESFATMLVGAVGARDSDQVRTVLHQAWDDASQATAYIADLTAEMAKGAGDPAAEYEANRRALDLFPSPVRRARTALSLIGLDRSDEALVLLSSPEKSLEEQIAETTIRIHDDEIDDPVANLGVALPRISAEHNLESEWFEMLDRLFQVADDMESAIKTAKMRVETYPASVDARMHLTRALQASGDQTAGLAQAELAHALSPVSQSARALLAESFEAIDQFEQGLAQRKLLADPQLEALAECAIKAEDFDYAGSVVEKMLVEDPGSVEAHAMLGRILAAKNETGPARAAFDEAIKLRPQNSAAYRALADFQFENDESEAAGQTLRAAAQAYPSDAAAQFELSRWLRSEKRNSEALQAAAQASSLEPRNVDYSIAHAELLVELGHTDQAIKTLRSAARRVPRDWRVRFALAKAFEQEGEFEQAADLAASLPDSASSEDLLIAGRIGVKAGKSLDRAAEALRQAEQLGNPEPSLDYWYGQALEKLGRFDEAFERYNQVIKHNGDSPPELRERSVMGTARAALGQGQISLALSTLDEARDEFGESSKNLALTSRVYQAAKLPDKALEMAEKAVETNRTDPAGWQALGEVLASSGDFVGAMSAIERLSSLDRSAIEGWIQLARLAGEAGEQPTARKALAEAIWNGRKEASVLAKAADTLAGIGARDSAIRMLNSAIRRRPDKAAFVEAIAKLHERAGDFQPALESWIQCGELRAEDSRPWIYAANCAKELGHLKDSVTLLERAHAVDPSSPGVRHHLANAYLQLGHKERGVSALIDALQESPNDASLVSEAAEAALQAGAVREALGMIGKGQQLAADEGRMQAGLAESFILLNEWEKAEAALAEAIENDRIDARVLAMLAIVRSRKSDRRASEEALAQAEAATAKTVHEAIWLARAQARQFKAKDALETLAAWDGNAFAEVEAIKLMLRMVDADWIFDQAEAQHIVENSPDVDLALAALGERDIADSIVEPLTAWRAAQEDPDQLADLVSEDPSGQMGEALVIAHLKRGAYDAALDAVAETLEVCSSAEWLAVLEGLCHQRNGNAEQARAAWSKAAGPIGPLADYLVGNSYSEVKSLERAAKHMHKAVTAWSDEPAWQHSLGDVYAESGKPDTALAHFQNAVSAAAGNHKYQLSLARAYRVSGHRMQAEDAYEIALQNGSPSIEAYREAGENALSLGKHEKALDRFEQAISLAPSDPVIRIGAARATQALGDSRRADVHLRAALELAPEMPEVLLGQGQLLMQAGETQSALRAFESALQAGADTAHVYRYQSRLHLQNGDSDRAMKSLRRALEAEPEDDRLWHDLALAFESQADMTSADEAVCEAIRISPLNPEYRLTLARVSRRVGNLDRAIEELRKGRQSAPSDARLPVETGLVHEDRREYSRALDAYREAIEMDADCLEAYYRAGILLRTLKAYRRAGEMLKHAAELAPINKDVLHQLAAVRALELVHG